MTNQTTAGSTPANVQKPTIAFSLSLIAAVLVIVQGIVRLVQSRILEVTGITDALSGRILAGLALWHLGTIALIFGALILVGAIVMYKTNMVMAGALVVLVFSILSIISGGLFGILGFIIGIIGSAIALAKRK